MLNLLFSALALAQNTTTPRVTTTRSTTAPAAPTFSPPNDNPNNDPIEAQYRGNCLSQRINFNDTERIFAMDGIDVMRDITDLDTGRYDMTIDYFKDQVKFLPGGGIELSLTPSKDPNRNPDAPRLSTTRFMLYGKIEAYLKAPAIGGIVTTFITMGPHLPDKELDLTLTDKQGGDEIDFEILGNDPMNAQSNIFYRGFKEYTVRGGIHRLKSPIDTFHKYTIDWRRDQIIFSIDDVVVRNYRKDSPQANSKESATRRFFPDRAGKIQIALWSDKNNKWAGGAPQFPPGLNTATATYQYIDIQCYDDQDKPVLQWPIADFNPGFRPTIPNQPTQGVNSAIPKTAGPNFQGEILPGGQPAPGSTGSAKRKSFSAIASVFMIAALL